MGWKSGDWGNGSLKFKKQEISISKIKALKNIYLLRQIKQRIIQQKIKLSFFFYFINNNQQSGGPNLLQNMQIQNPVSEMKIITNNLLLMPWCSMKLLFWLQPYGSQAPCAMQGAWWSIPQGCSAFIGAKILTILHFTSQQF